MEEIRPPVEKAKHDIVNALDYDTVIDFEYLQMCYSESLRIEPPVANSSGQTVMNDTDFTYGNGKKINLKPGMNFSINIESIHHNSDIWPEPEKFVPERFDK